MCNRYHSSVLGNIYYILYILLYKKNLYYDYTEYLAALLLLALFSLSLSLSLSLSVCTHSLGQRRGHFTLDYLIIKKIVFLRNNHVEAKENFSLNKMDSSNDDLSEDSYSKISGTSVKNNFLPIHLKFLSIIY